MSCPLPFPILQPGPRSTARGHFTIICDLNEGKSHLKIRWFKPPFHFLWTVLSLFPILSVVVVTFF